MAEPSLRCGRYPTPRRRGRVHAGSLTSRSPN